jgi:hypothetical protein
MFDLMQGARIAQLATLVPAGTHLEPSLAESVQVINGPKGPILELRLSEEANNASLGSAFEAAYISQLVSTACVNAGPERLPVRILVRCASCSGGWTLLKDGHVGPDGPMDSYTCQGQAPDEAFPDIAGHRYAREIAMAKGIKLAWSVGDGTFHPDELMTRADLVFLLGSALGLKPEAPSWRRTWCARRAGQRRTRRLPRSTTCRRATGRSARWRARTRGAARWSRGCRAR